ncbi:MAG: hypothetical protein WCB44_16855, partial [Stellaceae bacterium]
MLTGGPRPNFGHQIGRVVAFRHVLERGDPQIDLTHLDTGELETKIEAQQREILELLGEQPVIPGRNFAQPVIGDHEGLGLGRGEM